MDNFRIILTGIVFCTAIALPCKAAEQQIRVYAQAETGKDIYIGEKFGYHIVIEGDNKPGQVDLEPLKKFNPESAGNQDVSQTSISFINGKTTQNVVKRFVMSYGLTVNSEGPVEIQSIKVTIDGKEYQTNPVQINVIKPGTTDNLEIVTELSDQKCYVGQPVLMTINFYISCEVGPFNFSIPAFNSEAFYIEDPDVSGKEVKLFDLGIGGMTAYVSQQRVNHKGRDAVLLLSFSKVLIPKYAGEIVMAATSVSADVVVGQQRSRDTFGFFEPQKSYKRFMVSSQPSKLSVQPLVPCILKTFFRHLTR